MGDFTKIAGLWLFAMFFAGGLVGAAEGPPAAAKMDGVYALPGARLLRIDKDKFDISYDSRFGERAKISGHVFETDRQLQLFYFNGTAEIEVSVTAAILEGHLWIGVMRGWKDHWSTSASNPELFWVGENHIPNGSVTWDTAKGTWTYEPGSTSWRGILEGVKEVPAGKGRLLEKSSRTVAAIETDGGTRSEGEVGKWMQSLPQWSPKPTARSPLAGSMGVHLSAVVMNPGWKIGAASSKEDKVLTTDDVLEALKPLEKTAPRNASYEKVGDIMIIPWSIDLGPVGLTPAKADERAIVGKWIGADKKKVTVEKAVADARPYPLLLAGGRLPAAQIERTISELPISPDDGGIRTKGYGWDCQMNHMDHGGAIYWFVTAEKRLVRILYPAYCDGGSGGWAQKAQVDVFEKQAGD